MDNSSVALQNTEEIPVRPEWAIPEAHWSTVPGAGRSSTLTPLYVQRYRGPRVGNTPSWHRYWEMLYVFAGRGRSVDERRAIPLTPGTAILIPPRLVHYEDAPLIDIDTLWIGLAGSCLDTLPTDDALVVRNLELAPLCEALWLRTRLPHWAVSGMEIDGLTGAIVGRVLQAVAGGGDERVSEPERLSRVIWHIHANYASELTVATLAAVCDISEGHFYRWFQKRTGCTPRDFVARVRIDASQELLRQSGMPVGDVARRVGYADPLHFSRVFRQRVGLSPREWRASASGRWDEAGIG